MILERSAEQATTLVTRAAIHNAGRAILGRILENRVIPSIEILCVVVSAYVGVTAPSAILIFAPGHVAGFMREGTIRATRRDDEKTSAGKRKGTWALSEDAPEATKGFLLNHLIHELLPPKGDGLRWSNSDPITGQAAWFDLRVKIKKVAAPEESQPQMPAIKSPVGQGPEELKWKVGK